MLQSTAATAHQPSSLSDDRLQLLLFNFSAFLEMSAAKRPVVASSDGYSTLNCSANVITVSDDLLRLLTADYLSFA